MSFLKIKDPAKRDAIVKEYLDLKKKIRSNLLSERTGEMEMQTDLSKFFKPITETQKTTAKDITETQKTTAKEITEELKPIKEGIEKLPNSILIPDFPAIQATSEPTEREGVHYVNELALEYLMKYMSDEADRTFGFKSKDGKLAIGDKNVMIDGSDFEVLDSDGRVKKNMKEHLDYGNYLCLKNQMRKSLCVVIWIIMRICCIKLILYIRIMIQIRIVLKVIIKELAGLKLENFGIIRIDMKVVELWLFQVILTRC